ncbi:hypothetical protein [Paenibacillus endoradicis]|uniref:hypothetical protein n=1 Tax=Paenibacillus endoradicis TaxID=2972487 RepID=UPI002159AED9|nr:hypothetical protein [Paenibacillus endoradicis]MCR8658843.1 hypothetical protein [Paenibacillus endoradicis]
MRKWLLLIIAVGVLIVTACQKQESTAQPPPIITEEIDNNVTMPPIIDQTSPKPTNESTPNDNEPQQLQPEQLAQLIVEKLAQGQLIDIAPYVAEDVAVRFSPYPYIREDVDFELTQLQFVTAMSADTIVTAREYDGSGEPMELTFAQYYHEFINDRAYATDAVVGVNTTNGLGSMIQNWQDIYSTEQYTSVEYYIEGTAEYEGMDWNSLRLVFEEQAGQYFLVAVIHGQWTM